TGAGYTGAGYTGAGYTGAGYTGAGYTGAGYTGAGASGYSGVGYNSLYPQLPQSGTSPYSTPQTPAGYAGTSVYPPRGPAQASGATGGYSSTPYTGSPAAYTPYSGHLSGHVAAPRTTGASSTTAKPLVEKTHGAVALLLDKDGMPGYAKRNNQQPYALVTSVDPGMTLGSGIAKAVAEIAGDQYVRVSRDKANAPSFPGACFTYKCSAADKKLSASDLSNCKNIHNVYVPLTSEPNYQETLKNTFINIFTEANKNGNHSLICCFLGCGNAGGTGHDLATAVYAARFEFLKTSKVGLPNLTLVGMQTGVDQIVHDDFLKKWTDLENAAARNIEKDISQPGQRLKKAHSKEIAVSNETDMLASRRLDSQAFATSAATGGMKDCTHKKTLIQGMLNVVMHPDSGMFGVAKALSKTGEKFDLVNAANDQMDHSGGIAGEFSKRFSGFKQVTGNALQDASRKGNPISPGGCLTTNIKKSRLQSPADLAGCENIHNVVAPIFPGKRSNRVPSKTEQETYDTTFREAFVSLLCHAQINGGHKVVSCFIGCAIFGGNGTAMAKALHAAYHSLRIKSLSKIPQLVIAGWDGGSGGDKKVYDDFIKEFEELHKNQPVNLSSGTSKPSALYSSGVLGTGYTAGIGTTPKRLSASSEYKASAVGIHQVSDPDKSTTAAFNKGGKGIDCGICGESSPEKSSQLVKGVQVCSGCAAEYQDKGVDLAKVAKLDEEYAAIKYHDLQIRTESRDLPGYPGAGRIVVHIAATTPRSLSDGQQLIITTKAHDHYLPNNDIGKELLRLLKVLHKEKLIYKIDKSLTLGQLGITFNFHLKTADSGGEGAHGYPDQGYASRALNEIIGLAATHNLEDKLDTKKLIRLIQGG
nr:macro domain-containing protein [Endozoicomonas sp.]